MSKQDRYRLDVGLRCLVSRHREQETLALTSSSVTPTPKPTVSPACTVAVLTADREIDALRPHRRSSEVGSVLGNNSAISGSFWSGTGVISLVRSKSNKQDVLADGRVQNLDLPYVFEGVGPLPIENETPEHI